MQRLQGLPGVVAGLGFEERAEMSVLALPLCGPSLGELKRAFPEKRVRRLLGHIVLKEEQQTT